MDDLRKEVAIFVKRYRLAQGINRTELAKRVGISRASVVNIENGTQAVSLNNFCKIAFALQIRPQHLLSTILESKQHHLELSKEDEPDEKLREQINLSIMSKGGGTL